MPLSNFKPEQYADLLKNKIAAKRVMFDTFEMPEIEVFSSEPLAYRMRAEFRLWHDDKDLYYAMFKPGNPRTPYRIEHFPLGCLSIQKLMPMVLEKLKKNPILRDRLFQVKFLSSQNGKTIITLIYHRPLDELWLNEATKLAACLNVQLVGRSKKQKLIIENEYID